MIVISAFFMEVWKGLILLWNYKFNLVMQWVLLSVMFLGIGFILGEGEMEAQEWEWMALGFVFWIYAISTISGMGETLREEITTGTLEQLFMSPAPVWIILLGRVTSRMLSTTVMLFLLSSISWLITGISIPFNIETLPLMLLTLMGILGFGFLIGGASLLFKQASSLGSLIQNTILFFNGTLVAVEKTPTWMAIISKSLPTTEGIIVMRKVALGQETVGSLFEQGSLFPLLSHSILFLVVGILVFVICGHLARKKGTLGQY